MEWTTDALRAEVTYRIHGTRDCTSRMHLREVAKTAPAWWQRLGRHRPAASPDTRHTA